MQWLYVSATNTSLFSVLQLLLRRVEADPAAAAAAAAVVEEAVDGVAQVLRRYLLY
jgi:hypothetical protein